MHCGSRPHLKDLCVCVGGGSIGTKAARAALEMGCAVLLVDERPDCLAAPLARTTHSSIDAVPLGRRGEAHLLLGDATPTLLDILEQAVPDMVVPAVRGHFAALLAREYVARSGGALIPERELLRESLLSIPGEKVILSDEKEGVLMLSHMPEGRECNPNCSQPGRCPVTGKWHEVPMHSLIARALAGKGERHIVLVTESMGRVGLLRGQQLLSMLSGLDTMSKGDRAAIATTCGCHGIINFLRLGR
jgi:hypothetical protein